MFYRTAARPRKEVLSLRISSKEVIELETLAEKLHLSFSALAYKLIREGLERHFNS